MSWDSIIHLDKQLLLDLNGSDSLAWDQFMYWSTQTWAWLPFFLLLFYLVIMNNSSRKGLLIFVTIAIALLLAEGLSSGICKPMVARLRPTHDPEIMMMVHTVNGYTGGWYGFFSSHAANTFALFALLSLIVRSGRFALTMLAWAALHTFTRIYLGVHFPGDILVGMLWGTLVGSLLYVAFYFLSNRLFGAPNFVSEHCTSTGYIYTSINWVCMFFLLNVFGVLLFSFMAL